MSSGNTFATGLTPGLEMANLLVSHVNLLACFSLFFLLLEWSGGPGNGRGSDQLIHRLSLFP